jgi:hypothetical protein
VLRPLQGLTHRATHHQALLDAPVLRQDAFHVVEQIAWAHVSQEPQVAHVHAQDGHRIWNADARCPQDRPVTPDADEELAIREAPVIDLSPHVRHERFDTRASELALELAGEHGRALALRLMQDCGALQHGLSSGRPEVHKVLDIAASATNCRFAEW